MKNIREIINEIRTNLWCFYWNSLKVILCLKIDYNDIINYFSALPKTNLIS